jgi:hypothetical protein
MEAAIHPCFQFTLYKNRRSLCFYSTKKRKGLSLQKFDHHKSKNDEIKLKKSQGYTGIFMSND